MFPAIDQFQALAHAPSTLFENPNEIKSSLIFAMLDDITGYGPELVSPCCALTFLCKFHGEPTTNYPLLANRVLEMLGANETTGDLIDGDFGHHGSLLQIIDETIEELLRDLRIMVGRYGVIPTERWRKSIELLTNSVRDFEAVKHSIERIKNKIRIQKVLKSFEKMTFNCHRHAEACVICTDEFENEDVVVTPCEHVFHEQCIERWIYENCSCPICRHRFEDMYSIEEMIELAREFFRRLMIGDSSNQASDDEEDTFEDDIAVLVGNDEPDIDSTDEVNEEPLALGCGIEVGDMVEVVGLQNRIDLNGRFGLVKSFVRNERIAVELTGDRKVISAKPGNLCQFKYEFDF